jgi:hypothetical protein
LEDGDWKLENEKAAETRFFPYLQEMTASAAFYFLFAPVVIPAQAGI